MVKITSSLAIAALVAAPVFASANWDDLNTRDISEQPVFGRELTETEALFIRDLQGLFARDSEDLSAREIEVQDLAERSKIGRFFGHIWKGIKKVGSMVMKREDAEEISARDVDEFESREIDADEFESREIDIDELIARYTNGLDERDFDDVEEREIDELD